MTLLDDDNSKSSDLLLIMTLMNGRPRRFQRPSLLSPPPHDPLEGRLQGFRSSSPPSSLRRSRWRCWRRRSHEQPASPPSHARRQQQQLPEQAPPHPSPRRNVGERRQGSHRAEPDPSSHPP